MANKKIYQARKKKKKGKMKGLLEARVFTEDVSIARNNVSYVIPSYRLSSSISPSCQPLITICSVQIQ